MTNMICLVGRLVANPTLEETESEHQYSKITIAVPREYKNMEGIYEIDFIDVVLHNIIASRTVEFCTKGDLVGIKGRLQTNIYENENGEKKKEMIVIADKLTFLSSKKIEVDEDE